MGPFFALGHALGPPAVARRSGCGSGLVLALAAWGVVRLLDELLGPPSAASRTPSPARCSLLNPYVVVFANRTSVTLLGYAALPWLLLCVHRGAARRPRRLVVAGGVRAGRHVDGRRGERGGDGVGAARAGCCWLRLRAWARRRSAWRDVRALRLARRAVAALARRCGGSVPLLVQSRYGDRLPALHRAAGDDLGHDEPARVAAADGLLDLLHRRRLRRAPCGRTSATRGVLLFSPPVVARDAARARRWRSRASRWTRRWRYAPFFLALVPRRACS